MCYLHCVFTAKDVAKQFKEIKCRYKQIYTLIGALNIIIGITTYVAMYIIICYTVQEYNFRRNVTTYDSIQI